jgi:hypothetical protein
MSPRIGPRGITIQDVQHLAANGRNPTSSPAYQPSKPTYQPPTPPVPAFNAELLAAMMAGLPAPTFGDKYGGYSTQSMMNQAALGYALNWQDVANLAASKQASLAAPLEEGLNKVYATNAANQAFRTAVEPRTNPPAPMLPFNLGSNKPRNPVIEDANARTLASRQARMNASNNQAYASSQAQYDAQVLPYEQLALSIRETPISQLARQALTNIYGVDPNVARATFTEQTDLDYAKLMKESNLAAQGIDFSMSEAEMIYNAGGPQALKDYQDQKTYEAMNGTPTEQAKAQQDLIDAQNAPIDQGIFDSYGVRPKDITNADTATVRAMFVDPAFLSTWIQPSLALLDASNGNPGKTGADIAGQQAQAYLVAHPGDMLRAKTLAAIIAEFDFLSR